MADNASPWTNARTYIIRMPGYMTAQLVEAGMEFTRVRYQRYIEELQARWHESE